MIVFVLRRDFTSLKDEGGGSIQSPLKIQSLSLVVVEVMLCSVVFFVVEHIGEDIFEYKRGFPGIMIV